MAQFLSPEGHLSRAPQKTALPESPAQRRLSREAPSSFWACGWTPLLHRPSAQADSHNNPGKETESSLGGSGDPHLLPTAPPHPNGVTCAYPKDSVGHRWKTSGLESDHPHFRRLGKLRLKDSVWKDLLIRRAGEDPRSPES